MNFYKFVIYISVLSVILIGVNYSIFSYLKFTFDFKYLLIYLFLYILNIATFFILSNAAAKKPSAYVTAYMGVFGIKMFAALIFLVLVILFNKEFMKPIALTFLFCYISYFVLQVWASIKTIKKQDSSAA